MKRCLREVFEDQNHVELLETKLDALQGGNLDVRQCNNEERRIREMDETFRCRLQTHIRPERHAFEGEFPEGNIGF